MGANQNASRGLKGRSHTDFSYVNYGIATGNLHGRSLILQRHISQFLDFGTPPAWRSLLIERSQTLCDVEPSFQFINLTTSIMQLSAPLKTPVYTVNSYDVFESGNGWIRSRDDSIPVRLTITASGLFWQIFLAHRRAVGINSSCGTTALTTPHSCIFSADIGSPINAISDALCKPVH